MKFIERLTSLFHSEDALDAPPPVDDLGEDEDEEMDEQGKVSSSTVLPRLSTGNRMEAIAWWERKIPVMPVMPSVHLKGKDATLARAITLRMEAGKFYRPALTHGYREFLTKLARHTLTPSGLASLGVKYPDLPLRETLLTMTDEAPPVDATTAQWEETLAAVDLHRLVTGMLNLLLQKTLQDLCGEENPMAEDEYDHGVAAAVAAMAVGIKLGLHRPYFAYLTALFHDIGKALVYRLICDCAQESQHTLEQPVVDLLVKTHHQKMGQALAKSWGLPQAVTQIIGNHEGKLSPDDKLVSFRALIQLADETALRCGHTAGETSHHSNTILDCAAARVLRISKENAKQYLDHLPTLLVESTL